MLDKISKNSWQIRAVAVMIFLLGFAAGVLALNAYRAWSSGGGQVNRQDRFAQMSERLQLHDEQKAQVQQILGETREQLQGLRRESQPRVEEIRRQADERLEKVLTPQQWQQFKQMREETRGRGRRGRESSGNAPSSGER